jgi:hypothetical protein
MEKEEVVTKICQIKQNLKKINYVGRYCTPRYIPFAHFNMSINPIIRRLKNRRDKECFAEFNHNLI